MRFSIAALFLALPLCAQTLNINLDHLIPKAKNHTEITLSGDLLQAALKLAPEEAPKLAGITSVFVRTFEFANDGAYTEADVENIRKQATGPGWAKVISVREDGETTDILTYSENGQMRGFLVIAAEPRELTVVHIGGQVQLARLQEVVESTVKFDMASITAAAQKGQ